MAENHIMTNADIKGLLIVNMFRRKLTEKVDADLQAVCKLKAGDNDKAQELFERRRFGVRRVKQELQQKGIDAGIVSMVLEEFSPETEETVEKIRETIERKYPAAREDEKIRRRAIAALQRYGYKLDDIFAVINEDAFE